MGFRIVNNCAARRLIEEAQLFIEACHGCYGRAVAEAVAV